MLAVGGSPCGPCAGQRETRAPAVSVHVPSRPAFADLEQCLCVGTADFQSVLCLRASMKVVPYFHQAVHAVGECNTSRRNFNRRVKPQQANPHRCS